MKLREAILQPATTISEDVSVVDVAIMLRDKKLRHVYVIDSKDFPVGVLSITDINAKIVAEGKSPQGMIAKQVMTTPLHMMDVDHEVGKAYQEMLAHSTLALPITDNGLLIGVLSMGEALKLIVAEKRRG